MGWFKRLCLSIFGLAGLLALAALILPWIGPYTKEATSLILTNVDYWYAVLVVSGITAVGALICFLRALFSPRNRKVVTVSRVDGGQITVTRSAIASQAKHIVESDGSCTAANTRVKARKRSVRVYLRVTPKHAMNVVDKGEELHNELVQGLQGVCGDTLKDVSIVFTDPESFEEPKPDYLSTTYAGYTPDDSGSYEGDAYSEQDAPNEATSDSGLPTSELVDGITVPLHSARHSDEGLPTDEPLSLSEADSGSEGAVSPDEVAEPQNFSEDESTTAIDVDASTEDEAVESDAAYTEDAPADEAEDGTEAYADAEPADAATTGEDA